MNVTQFVSGDIVSTVKDVLVAFAAVGTVAAAFMGLSAWRRELRGRTEYDLARRVIKATYGVMSAIQDVRHPFMYVGEFERSAEQRGKTYDPRDLSGAFQEFVYEDRWKALQEALIVLDTEVVEAQVVWGLAFKDRIEPLKRCVGELRYHLGHYLRERDKTHTTKAQIDKFEAAHDVVYTVSDDPDKDQFLRKMLDAVDVIESEVRPFMGKASRRGNVSSKE